MTKLENIITEIAEEIWRENGNHEEYECIGIGTQEYASYIADQAEEVMTGITQNVEMEIVRREYPQLTKQERQMVVDELFTLYFALNRTT